MNTSSRFFQRNEAVRHGMVARKLLSLFPIYASSALRGRPEPCLETYEAQAIDEARQAAHWWARYRGERP